MSNLPPVGKHRARAIEAKLGYTSKNTPQIAVRFSVYDAQGVEGRGGEITGYLYLSENAFARSVESLRHTGWQGDDLSDLSTVGSKDCEIEVADEEYEGKVRTKVNWVNPLDAGGVRLQNEMSPEEAKRFAASMRGKVRAVKAAPATPKPTPTPRPSAPPPSESEDFGF